MVKIQMIHFLNKSSELYRYINLLIAMLLVLEDRHSHVKYRNIITPFK